MIDIWKYREFTPLLLKEIDKPFNSNDYLYEIKFDGYRALIFVNEKEIQIKSRNHVDITYLYPELENIKKLVRKNTILDGEIISTENGLPSFSKLQQRSKLKDKFKIKKISKEDPVTFVAFDILYENRDLTSLPLIERKEILNKIDDSDIFVKSKVYKDGIKLFKEIKKRNIEGIVAKRKDSQYEKNTRTDNWIKIKNLKDEEFYIGGYKSKKKNYISLLLGEKIEGNLYYVGNASITTNSNLYNKVINSKVINKSSFMDYDEKNIKYVLPKIKCRVKYLERTRENHLRQPIIQKEND